jgi:hypothetical protein
MAWPGGPAAQNPPVGYLDLRDRTTKESFMFTATTKDGSSLPTAADLLALATNEELVTALEAADSSTRK